jgi:hypothetical protein
MNIPDIELTIQTLRDAASVFEDIAYGTVTPDTLRRAAECRKNVVAMDLDHVLGYVAGMLGGGFADRPMEMIRDLQWELSDALVEIDRPRINPAEVEFSLN